MKKKTKKTKYDQMVELNDNLYKKSVKDIDDALMSVWTTDKKQWRKERPLATGVLAYFPDALLEVAHTSFKGNEQHNAGQPLHWAREKSTDQLDAALRHITDHLKGEPIDDDGCYHLSKAAWRILAHLQITLENK